MFKIWMSKKKIKICKIFYSHIKWILNMQVWKYMKWVNQKKKNKRKYKIYRLKGKIFVIFPIF